MSTVPRVATGQGVDRRVAITFDDVPATALPACGPATVDSLTGRLLDTLDEFDVRAMAFVVESRSCGPDVRGTLIRTLERWLDGGHDLGNHTASHPDLNRVSLERYEEDMLLGAQVADSLLRTRGRRLRHFRPPYLHMGPTREKREGLRRLLMKHRYELGPVTMDNQEWVYEAAYRRAVTAGRGALAARIAEAYLEHMEEVFTYYEALSRKELGREIPHILLLHANVINGDHLASVLRILEQRGYRFISVDDALEDPAYDLPDRYVGRMGLSWLQRWLLTRGADVPPEPREVAWVARLAAGDGLPRVHGFRWRRAERWLEGRLTLLPGSPGPWGLLDLPAREGRTRLPVTRIDTAEGRLAFTIGDPEGSLSVADTAAGGGLLVIREDTFRVADFRALDADPDPGVVALIGVDPVAPGILSTDRAEEFPSFTPSGDTLYLSRSFREVLQSVRGADGAWGPLTPAPYGSDYRDRAAEVSPDGTALYLTSNRPLPGESREVDNRNHDLWRVPRSLAGGWGEPEPLPGGVNTHSAEYHPSATLDHTLYFSGWSRPGGFGRSDLYRAERTGEEWSPAENLGPVINGPGSESDVFVDPAERYIIFVSTDRPDSRGGDDLYISWRVGDRWSEPRNLGTPVNTFSYEYGPTVSPDGRWLYFTSHRRASADLYRVRLNAILDRSFTPYTDEAAVRTALQHYLAGHATGQGAHFDTAFHDVANLYWIVDGVLRTRTSASYIAGAGGSPAANERDRERWITWVEVTGDAAVARIDLDYPGVFITDYMSLLEVDGEWRIVNKIFHVDRRGAEARGGRPALEDGRRQIEAASRAFSSAYVSGDTATLRDLYSADAVLLPPEREVRGRDAIVRYFAPSPRRRNLAHAMRSDQVRIFGETAIDVGEWSNTWQVGETAPREASGRYLVVWRKGTDGRWRMAYDMWHRPID